MKIYDIDETQIENLTLQEPTRIQGGAFFSKIKYEGEDFYINTPKSQTKNGIVRTGKRMYVDLLYDESNTSIINWVLDLEKVIKQKLFEKSSLWFHNDMDLDDIDYFYNTPLRTYKGNKYLLRCNVVNKTTFNNKQTIQIFDESENVKDIDDVKDKSILSIAQICGVRFTNNSFHLEIMIKQTMILNEEPLFNGCMIRRNKPVETQSVDSLLDTGSLSDLEESDCGENSQDENDGEESVEEDNDIKENDGGDEEIQKQVQDEEDNDKKEDLNNKIQDKEEQQVNKEVPKSVEDNEIQQLDINQKIDSHDKKEEITLDITDDKDTDDKGNDDKDTEKMTITDKETEEENTDIVEVKDLGILDQTDDLEEYSINIDEIKNDTAITLKKPNEVYYEIYREARRKAKNAKKAAIIAYLEAKNIKNTYMLENIDDDSSDDDFDIDDLEQNLNGE